MNTRRNFIKTIAGVSAGIAGIKAVSAQSGAVPSRAAGAQYMGDFVAPVLDTIKVAIIGLGARGGTHYNHLATFENTEVVGLCDLHADLCERAKKVVLEKGKGRHTNVKLYSGDEHAYKKMLAETKPDLVYVVTPWEWHAPMAIDSMKAGAHVGVEVPLATTLEECWQIIDVSEQTQRHCMMLENVNYGRTELLFLNMARQGIFGDLLHAEAAYIHELRGQMHDVERGRGTGSWRTGHWASKSGNLYPTHGLGPVAQYMNLARGDDNFKRLVSFSSPAKNHALFAEKHFDADSKLNQMKYEGGDINTSIIKTTLGRTVMVQWDESSPRPYTRHNLIQGTKGAGIGYPFAAVALDYRKDEGLPESVFNVLAERSRGGEKVIGDATDFHRWAKDEKMQAVYEAWDHPLYTRLETVGRTMGGHGGMDAMMNFRVIECLRKGEPLDQNVYEGAFWSAVTPLSIKSVETDGMPQDFPDFTRGKWNETKPLPIVS